MLTKPKCPMSECQNTDLNFEVLTKIMHMTELKPKCFYVPTWLFEFFIENFIIFQTKIMPKPNCLNSKCSIPIVWIYKFIWTQIVHQIWKFKTNSSWTCSIIRIFNLDNVCDQTLFAGRTNSNNKVERFFTSSTQRMWKGTHNWPFARESKGSGLCPEREDKEGRQTFLSMGW